MSMTITGTSSPMGTAVRRASQRATKNPTRLERSVPATSPNTTTQTISMCSFMSHGPTATPCRVNAPRSTAMAADPGMPNARVGTASPPMVALLAVSAATSPSMEPLPIFGSLDIWAVIA